MPRLEKNIEKRITLKSHSIALLVQEPLLLALKARPVLVRLLLLMLLPIISTPQDHLFRLHPFLPLLLTLLLPLLLLLDRLPVTHSSRTHLPQLRRIILLPNAIHLAQRVVQTNFDGLLLCITLSFQQHLSLLSRHQFLQMVLLLLGLLQEGVDVLADLGTQTRAHLLLRLDLAELHTMIQDHSLPITLKSRP